MNIKTDDLILIVEALTVYQMAIEDDTENYYHYPYSIEQVQQLINSIETELDGTNNI